MRSMRLFVAVNFSGKIKAGLTALQKELKQVPSDARWVKEDNFHLTIKFLGDTPADQAPLIAPALQRAVTGIEPFYLHFKDIGFFPDEKKPRVLWVGVDGEVDILARLQRQVDKALKSLGFVPEKRRFSPHLTLARFKSAYGLDDLITATGQIKDRTIGPVQIKGIDLMQSELGSGGSKYYVLTGIALS